MGRKAKKLKNRRTAYSYFVKEYSTYLKKKNPKISFSECSKLCAAKWKHMAEQEKEKYKKMSRDDEARFQRQMKKLTPRERKAVRKRKDPSAPLKPLSAYMWFCKGMWKEIAKRHPTKSRPEIMREIAKMWAGCDEVEKKKYEAISECDRLCYDMEKKKYSGRQ